jgi:peroxiredoxin
MTTRVLRVPTAFAIGIALAFGARHAAAAPGPGEKAPDFTLQTIDGRSARLTALTARSPTVVVVLRGYPGYQCPNCTAQGNDLLRHAEEIKRARGQLIFVYPGPAQQLTAHAREFIGRAQLPAHFLFALDPDYRFTNAYGLRWEAPGETAYPATFVIDSQNRVRFAKVSPSHGGRATAADILQALGQIR